MVYTKLRQREESANESSAKGFDRIAFEVAQVSAEASMKTCYSSRLQM